MLKSEKVVIESPMSFAGSAKRSWKLTYLADSTTTPSSVWEKIFRMMIKVFLALLALIVMIFWWFLIVCWYLIFGILVIPYRLLRRSQRRDKKSKLQHREMMEQIKKNKG